MFVGHFAAALAAKRAEPRLSLGALVGAAFALDLIWPVFLLAGIERVSIDPGNTRFTPLAFDHYPWSHSLLMAVVWSMVLAILLRRNAYWRPALVAAIVVISHWVLDLVTHRADLPLWPGGPLLGLGLWNSVAGTFAIEGLFFAVALVLYLQIAPPRDNVGRWGLRALVVLLLAIWIASPFSPPPPGTTVIAAAGLALWLLPPWAGWVDRHRRRY